MDLGKEIEETRLKIQNLMRELQMLEQAKNEKTSQVLKLQGVFEFLEKIKNEEKKE